MKNHIVALAEAVRLARRELDLLNIGETTPGHVAKRLAELLENDDVNDALAALNMVDDALSIQADPPVDLRVPYPWRSH